jgi:hypothetical protein
MEYGGILELNRSSVDVSDSQGEGANSCEHLIVGRVGNIIEEEKKC